MDNNLVELVAANVAFVGSHFAMSHPLRAPIISVIGPRLFQLFYTIVSIAALYWVVSAYGNAPPSDLPGSGQVGWIIASLLTLFALVLLTGSLAGNPALPLPGAEAQARREPHGVFKVTRHPMMWGIALWALAHVVLWWSWRSALTALAMGILALVGSYLQDARKEIEMAPVWGEWQEQTSWLPRWGQFASVGLLPWAVGLMLWVMLTYAHWPLANVPAGIWRWF